MIPEGTLIHKAYENDDHLSTNECAGIARVNRRTVVSWIKEGKLPATRLPGRRGHYRIRWEDFHRILNNPALQKDTTDDPRASVT